MNKSAINSTKMNSNQRSRVRASLKSNGGAKQKVLNEQMAFRCRWFEFNIRNISKNGMIVIVAALATVTVISAVGMIVAKCIS